MVDYEKKILLTLVESYRDSKKDNGTNQINRRTQVKPVQLYKGYNQNDGDMEQIEAINHAVEKLREKGFLTFKINGFSNEIATIYLVDESIAEAEAYLSENYQYESKHQKMEYVKQMLRTYSGCSPIANEQCEKLRNTLANNRVPKDYLKIEDILKALMFIENNKTTLYLREASMLIYGSSKYFEENSLDSVCKIIRSFLNRPCEENEMLDEILNEYGIFKEKQKICLKGNITLIKNGRRFEISMFPDGIEFYADELPQIECIEIHTRKFVTVENKTAYLRCCAPDSSYFYLGGYANRYQRDFLKKAYENNRTMKYSHFGDIDAGGFFIHEHLCRMTDISFQLEYMSKEQLEDERFRACLQNLTINDRKRLKTLLKVEQYQDVVQYMLNQNVKLEQEIVSYSFDI